MRAVRESIPLSLAGLQVSSISGHQSMNGKCSKWLIVPVAALAIAAVAWWWLRKTPSANPSATVSTQAVPGTIQSSPVSTESIINRAQLLQSASDELVTAQTIDGKNRALGRLREAMAAGSTNEMAAAIRQFLDTKTDASTGQGFKIGGNGSLLQAPTLRTFLLDQLAMLDPVAAAAYARVILETSASPDEWAVALRNLSSGDTSPDSRTLLETKTGELLRNEAWQREASVGYLEAFDTAVELGGTKLLPPLSDLVRAKDNQAVAHAAYLTLDRLVINQPAQTLEALNEHPEWMQGREETRANYFARADVSDPRQRRILELYLLDASRSPAELQAFAGVFPNANFMVSQNLLTTTATPDLAWIANRDAASLQVVDEWLADPRFAGLKLELAKVRQRLEAFAQQAGGGK
jgi:hypothetical protein